MAGIEELDFMNLFVDDADPESSLFQIVESVKLPMISERTTEHNPGGSFASIKIGSRFMEALEMTFKTRGLSTDLYKVYGINGFEANAFTFRGNMRDIQTGAEKPVVAVVRGRLIKLDQSEFSRGEKISSDYSIDEIASYSLTIGGQEKVYFNPSEGPLGFRVDGKAVFEAAARNIGLL